MNQAEKISALGALVDIEAEDDDVLSAFLNLAGQKIIARAYPYDSTVTEVPVRYESLQLEIAAYLLNKRGAEGQTSHDENGIKRVYENADVPASMLKAITPKVGVL